jgi:hypothetical protein
MRLKSLTLDGQSDSDTPRLPCLLTTFLTLLAEIEDPRRAQGKLYRLPQSCCSCTSASNRHARRRLLSISTTRTSTRVTRAWSRHLIRTMRSPAPNAEHVGAIIRVSRTMHRRITATRRPARSPFVCAFLLPTALCAQVFPALGWKDFNRQSAAPTNSWR